MTPKVSNKKAQDMVKELLAHPTVRNSETRLDQLMTKTKAKEISTHHGKIFKLVE